MSRRNSGRPINGMLLLDKSPGMTSNGAVQRIKRLLQARKVGHTGSLDPIATGLLPLCLGEATKLTSFLLNTDKRYRVLIRLGKTTSTADIEGEVLAEKPVPTLTEALIESVLDRFRGDISQVPPMHSALKHRGRRLYELARQGIEVERPARQVSIYELRLVEFGPDCLDLDVHCSKGTYIRSLAEDIGAALGCGGHVEQLRRTAVGDFSIDQAVSFEQLETLPDEERLARLLPLDWIIAKLPTLSLAGELAFFLRRGQPVFVPNAPTAGLIRLYTKEGAFLGIGEVMDDGKITPRRLVREATAPQKCVGSSASEA